MTFVLGSCSGENCKVDQVCSQGHFPARRHLATEAASDPPLRPKVQTSDWMTGREREMCLRSGETGEGGVPGL